MRSDPAGPRDRRSPSFRARPFAAPGGRTRLAEAALALLFLSAAPLSAQQFRMPTSVPPTNAPLFSPFEIHSANEMRTGGGEPGPQYWQQRADYRIQVSLHPENHEVVGSEEITYTNNSPDSLDVLWLQMGQNLFVEGSRGSWVNPGNRWRGAFEGGGFQLKSVSVGQGGHQRPADYLVDGTRMRIALDRPLAGGGRKIRIDVSWSFIVPQYGADRMGRLKTDDGWIYEIAQWYPRMFVYDDLHGWDTLPYLGQGEFYLEYGSFDVRITAPRDLLVFGTGTLENPGDVLTDTERQRLDRALHSEKTVTIVSKDEVGSPSTRPSGNGPLTWHFTADSVRDFSWAASRAFIWDAAGWDGIRIQSAYPKEALGPDAKNRPGWEMATQYLRHTISYYSGWLFHYPYPVATNIAGVVGGMEYPSIVFCSYKSRGRGLYDVTDHEFGHTWFPMVVGSNERRHAWMDEGFNTFINHYSQLDYFGGDTLAELQKQAKQTALILTRVPFSDQPILTRPDLIRRHGLGILAYLKPGYGLEMLRQFVLGPKLFDSAFREYIRRWAFRHPDPDDFFRTIDDVAGQDLDWFWRGWFADTVSLDQAVDSVQVVGDTSRVYLSNRKGFVMPTTVRLTYADGDTAVEHLPVEIWATSDDYRLDVVGKGAVTGAEVDPEKLLPDVDRGDDAWPRPTPAHAKDGGEGGEQEGSQGNGS